MRCIALVALACLAGCVNTIETLQHKVPSVTHQSRLDTVTAAACVSRNMEKREKHPNTVLEGPRRGDWQVGMLDGMGGMVVYALATPTKEGSSIELWLDRWERRQDSFGADAFRGC